jgi:hypothetical protein
MDSMNRRGSIPLDLTQYQDVSPITTNTRHATDYY